MSRPDVTGTAAQRCCTCAQSTTWPISMIVLSRSRAAGRTVHQTARMAKRKTARILVVEGSSKRRLAEAGNSRESRSSIQSIDSGQLIKYSAAGCRGLGVLIERGGFPATTADSGPEIALGASEESMMQVRRPAWRRSGVERRNHERRAIGAGAVPIDEPRRGRRNHGRRLTHRRGIFARIRDRRIGD